MKLRCETLPFILSLVMLLSVTPVMTRAAIASQENSMGTQADLSNNGRLNINLATKEELMTLPGIDGADAQKIIDGRPYDSKADLLQKKIISPMTFYGILDKIEIVIEKKPQPKKPKPAVKGKKK